MRYSDTCFKVVSTITMFCSGAVVLWCMLYGMQFGAAVWSVSLLLCVLSYPTWEGRDRPDRSRYWVVYTVVPAAFFLFMSIAYSALVRFDAVSLLGAIPLGLITYRGICGILYAITQNSKYITLMV